MQPSKKARLLLPKPDGEANSNQQENGVPLKRKRDKALAACEGCRKRKVRCDSKRPACGQCSSNNIECRYPVPEGMTPRESQKQQVERASTLRTVLEMLRQRSDMESVSILRSIREAGTLDDAVSMIADANLLLPMGGGDPSPKQSCELYPPRVGYPCNNTSAAPSLTPILENSAFDIRGLNLSLNEASRRGSSVFASLPLGTLPLSHWTRVSRDDKYLTHLLNLFWTWDHTLCRIVDRTTFLDELSCEPAAEVRFCSQFMVNALLAVASIYQSQSKSNIDIPDNGRAFANEAFHLLETERNYQSITLLQGLALLWVYEGNCGDKARAVNLLNEMYHVYGSLGLGTITIPTGTYLTDPSAQRKWHAISCICWGFYCLSTKLSLAFAGANHVGRPRIAKRFEDEGQFLTHSDMTIHLWSPYPQSTLTKCSLSQETFQAECYLASLVEEVLSVVSTRSRSGQDPIPDYGEAEVLYHKLLGWKKSLPESLQVNNNVLPSVVFLHSTFHMAILKLVEPFSEGSFRLFGDGTGPTLRLTNAMNIMSNLWAYRAAFGLRHEYWLMQACYASADSVLRDLNTSTAAIEVFARACRLLYDIGVYLPLANEYLTIVKSALLRNKVQPPASVAKIFSGLAVRGGSVHLKGVRLALPLHDEKGLEMVGSLGSPQDVSFSERIGSIAGMN